MGSKTAIMVKRPRNKNSRQISKREFKPVSRAKMKTHKGDNLKNNTPRLRVTQIVTKSGVPVLRRKIRS
jgi:hypothetical protein